MNAQEAAKVLAYLKVAYPNYQIPDVAAHVWADEFADVPVAAVYAAAKAHAAQSQFAPTFAEIHAVLEGGDELASLTPDRVWSSIRSQIGDVGTNGRPVLTELEWEVVSQLGGWRVMCQSQTDDIQKRLPRIVDEEKRAVRRKQRLEVIEGANICKIGVG